MKIAINGWFFGQASNGSGQYLHHLLAHLPPAAPQHQFVLLVPSLSADQASHQKIASLAAMQTHFAGMNLADNVALQTVSQPNLQRNLAKLWWEQFAVPRAAQQQNASRLWVPYWAAPRWQPCPTIVTIHDLIPLLLPAYRGGRLNRLYTKLVSHTAKHTSAIITVSEASKRDVVEHLGIPAERVYAIPHGPNQAIFDAMQWNQSDISPERATEVQQKYQLPSQFFLYLGGFDVRKNVQSTLQAYRQYLDKGGNPDIRLVIAGKLPATDTDFAPDPQRMVTELNLLPYVDFCGWVDDADKLVVYSLAHAYIFPSVYEGFGMMVLEAMSAGTPVVTSG
ncbi:MAG: glycosyltransferase family 1 protein [Chloroflexota bacterium]